MLRANSALLVCFNAAAVTGQVYRIFPCNGLLTGNTSG
jgi:hypothetical protein